MAKKENSWVSVTDAMPPSLKRVLVRILLDDKKAHTTVGMYVQKHQEEAEMEYYEDDVLDYSEETGIYYVKQGWYEQQLYSDINYRIDHPVTHWMYLPEAPRKS